jgi:hypothetical protein
MLDRAEGDMGREVVTLVHATPDVEQDTQTSETSSNHAVPAPALKSNRNHTAWASDGIGGRMNVSLWKYVQSCVPVTYPISFTYPSAGTGPPAATSFRAIATFPITPFVLIHPLI